MSYINVVKREIERIYKSSLFWFCAFIMPLILCLLICLIFSNASPKSLPIGVLDLDNSQLSRTIERNLHAIPSIQVKYQLNDMREAKKFIICGKIYGFILIPKNFQRDIYRFSQPKLVFYYNNQRLLISGIISKDITLYVQSLIVGLDAKLKQKRGLPFDEAVKQSNLINVVEHVRSNPYFNYLYMISLTAFGHILQITMVLFSVFAIGTEFKYGTTKEWLKTAGDSIIIALLGKFTPYFIIFTLLFLIVYFIYFGIYQVPYVGNILFGIISTILFVLASLSYGVIFISINGNFRYCLSASIFYVAIGFALAGITFPVMSMPLVVKIYAYTMPLVHWVQVMIDQSLRNIPALYDCDELLILFCLVCIPIICTYRLKKLAQDESRWYKL